MLRGSLTVSMLQLFIKLFLVTLLYNYVNQCDGIHYLSIVTLLYYSGNQSHAIIFESSISSIIIFFSRAFSLPLMIFISFVSIHSLQLSSNIFIVVLFLKGRSNREGFHSFHLRFSWTYHFSKVRLIPTETVLGFGNHNRILVSRKLVT